MTLDERNVYVGGNGFGILVFFRGGGKPTVINTKNGLPHLFVQGLAHLNGKLYAVVGDYSAATWFVEIDLKTQKVNILSSSLGKTDSTPFHSDSAPKIFSGFVQDAEHHRILFVAGSDKSTSNPPFKENPQDGLWSMDSKGQFSRLFSLPSIPYMWATSIRFL